MKTASVHDLKNDLKMLFVNRFIGHGFELPVILFTGRTEWRAGVLFFRMS